MSLPDGYAYLQAGETLIRLHHEHPEAYEAFLKSLKPWQRQYVKQFFERRASMQNDALETYAFYPHAVDMVHRLSEKAGVYYHQCQQRDD